MKIRQNIKLSDFNTFRTGGNARFFCEVKSDSELTDALIFAKTNKLKFFVIGNGSNVLLNDRNFSGLVIKICIKNIKIESTKDADFCGSECGFSWTESTNGKRSVISASAGESFNDLIKFSIKNNLSGIENLWNIPGTVGASIVQNIGAYGVEVKNHVISVEGIDANTLNKFIFNNINCKFGYRDSVFKKNKNLVITKVFYKLNNFFKPNLRYIALKEVFLNIKTPNIIEVVKAIEVIRKDKLPDWKKNGTAGSFFKNSIVSEKKYKELLIKYPNLPKHEARKGFVKIPLGFVLDKICGLKGKRIGKVGLYEKQSLVIVNYGGATFNEIDNFAKFIEKEVYKKIKIKIEREVEII
ncbi:MAG: UDP-N-acetylmuramate dehydrogenase [bacterium]